MQTFQFIAIIVIPLNEKNGYKFYHAIKKKLLNYAYLPEFYHMESWVLHYKKLWVLGDLEGVKDKTDQWSWLALQKNIL